MARDVESTVGAAELAARQSHLGAVLVLALVATSCATITENVRVIDRPLPERSSVRHEVSRDIGTAATTRVEESPESVSIFARAVQFKTCSTERHDLIERRTVTERYWDQSKPNSRATIYFWFGAGLVASVVGGAYKYSVATTPGQRSGAVALMAGGSGLALSVPLGNEFRAIDSSSSEEVDRHETKSARCKEEPARVTVLRVEGLGGVLVDGTTNAGGELAVQVSPGDILRRGPGFRLVAGKSEIGKLKELDAAYASLKDEDQAWRRAELEECRATLTIAACDGAESYVRLFPRGAHVREADEAIRSAAPKMHLLRDDAQWSKADREKCKRAETANACADVEGYAKAYPSGSHGDEARALLKGAAPRLALLRAQREEQERELMEMKSLVEVSNVQAHLTSGAPVTSGAYIEVAFDVTLRTQLPSDMMLGVRAACYIGEKRIVSTAPALDAVLNDLNVGDTGQARATPFILEGLPAAPRGCDLVIYLQRGLVGETKPVARRCWGQCK